jgi:HSP20 family protein
LSTLPAGGCELPLTTTLICINVCAVPSSNKKASFELLITISESRDAISLSPGSEGGVAMNTTFADPFDTLFRLQRELEARRASDWLDDTTSGVGAFPPINVFQQGHDFVAIVELPGVDKTDLELHAFESAIRISGKKSIDYGEKVSVHRRERVAGTFDRTITVPVQIDADGIKAEFSDGILTLYIPRAESDKPRAIKIN